MANRMEASQETVWRREQKEKREEEEDNANAELEEEGREEDPLPNGEAPSVESDFLQNPTIDNFKKMENAAEQLKSYCLQQTVKQ